MNCPSRTDNPDGREGWNQSPNKLSGTTREDFNGIANTRILRRIEPSNPALVVSNEDEVSDAQRPRKASATTTGIFGAVSTNSTADHVNSGTMGTQRPKDSRNCSFGISDFIPKARKLLVTFSKFIGPGFMVCTYLHLRSDVPKTRTLTKRRYQLLILTLETMQPMWPRATATGSSYYLSF
jgi:metal iron transporter